MCYGVQLGEWSAMCQGVQCQASRVLMNAVISDVTEHCAFRHKAVHQNQEHLRGPDSCIMRPAD
jgi:hypothetical protein